MEWSEWDLRFELYHCLIEMMGFVFMHNCNNASIAYRTIAEFNRASAHLPFILHDSARTTFF
jgi:hypothetical protein